MLPYFVLLVLPVTISTCAELLFIGKNMITGDLTSVCSISSLKVVTADCPPKVLCPCCAYCIDENNNVVSNHP